MHTKSTNGVSDARWLLLIHQIPPKPDYFRVKIWRRLQNLGCVAIKNSVYALPNSDQGREDFQWIAREIASGGGEAMVCEARVIEGLSDNQIVRLFQEARDRDYLQIAGEARKLAAMLRAMDGGSGDRRVELANHLVRLKRHLAEVAAIDFFEARTRKEAEQKIAALEIKMRAKMAPKSRAGRDSPSVRALAASSYRVQDYRGRTWVTRQGIHVDRMASAWLIRRFIDERARFKFVSPEGYQPAPGELRFDMFEAEFTHVGNRCTFEVICERFGLRDPALRVIAEIIHDIDLKESKYHREETPGISRLIEGISMSHKVDEVRLPRGCAVFDDLYECFRRQKDGSSRRCVSGSPGKPKKLLN